MLLLIPARGFMVRCTINTITVVSPARIMRDSTPSMVSDRLRVAFTSEIGSVATASQPVVALFLNMEVYRMPL